MKKIFLVVILVSWGVVLTLSFPAIGILSVWSGWLYIPLAAVVRYLLADLN